MQQVICDVPYRDKFIVRWRVQLRKNRSALSTFVEKDSPSSTGQRKVRLSEGRPILVTFHFFLVLLGATNVFSELIHPRLKLPNRVLTGAPKENMVQNHLNIALLNVFQYLNGRYRHTFIP